MKLFLYVKTHKITGLKYLGKTTSKNPEKYPGSGIYWIDHLKKHGYDYDTEILCECSSNEEIKKWGLYYSNLWNIVESNEWANLKLEQGDGGGVITHSKETRKKISETLKENAKNKKTTNNLQSSKIKRQLSEETKDKIRNSLIGKKLSEETKAKMRLSRKGKKKTDETRKKMSESHKGKEISEETKSRMSNSKIGKKLSEETKAKMSASMKGRVPWNKKIKNNPTEL